MTDTKFEDRRKNDPQGLIDSLIGQATRQAKVIHDAHQWIDKADAARLEFSQIEVLLELLDGCDKEKVLCKAISKKLNTKVPDRPKRATDKKK